MPQWKDNVCLYWHIEGFEIGYSYLESLDSSYRGWGKVSAFTLSNVSSKTMSVYGYSSLDEGILLRSDSVSPSPKVGI